MEFARIFGLALMTLLLSPGSMGRASAGNDEEKEGRFRLLSSQFKDNTTLPLITIFNNQVNGVNTCSIDGSPGGDQSPELHWRNAPKGTRTFVVIDYDVTAAFTHWGMYNIPASTQELPPNAGVAGSAFGAQVFNDFFLGEQYDGPCPPRGVAPVVHHYVFTVYALDIELNLPGSPNFPPAPETLYHALIAAGREDHILGSASLTGLYSSTSAN
jgi:Raf kinase inhibitor-like YbhB/YbcL family protein